MTTASPRQKVMPLAAAFNPHLVVVSAGFDAALGDPLGECTITPGGYAAMTHMLRGLAGGKVQPPPPAPLPPLFSLLI
jgi:histone deacetylase 6